MLNSLLIGTPLLEQPIPCSYKNFFDKIYTIMMSSLNNF